MSCNAQGRLSGDRGNILIYVLMTMVIFAVIGVTMVSLFSTSISSSATANETRRAFYLSESGIRYAMSELRQRPRLLADEHQPAQQPTTYKVAAVGRLRRYRFRRLVPDPPAHQNVAGGQLRSRSRRAKSPRVFLLS